ncbi:MAG: hypothetical protein KDA20_13595, partial [Phycisphaerales bacterium]|nr:hypothetical protein [Phycisphaerales bacterium]
RPEDDAITFNGLWSVYPYFASGTIIGSDRERGLFVWSLDLPSSACDGDANNDNTVDVNDVSYVLFRLGSSGSPGAVDGDANLDGVVDVNDISYVLFRLGPCA